MDELFGMRYTQLKGPSIYAPVGAISSKSVPPGWVETEVKEIPDELNSPLIEFMNPGEWKGLKDDAFSLPLDSYHGEIRPTKQGHLYIFIQEDVENPDSPGNWFFFSSVAGVR